MKPKQSETMLPALDSEGMRELNTKKIVDGIQSIGEYYKVIKESTKWNVIASIIFTVAVGVILIGALIVGVINGGVEGVWDTRASGRRFNCTSSIAKDYVRNYQDAKIFTELYNGTCIVYQIKGEK
jgi:hypothetical protein